MSSDVLNALCRQKLGAFAEKSFQILEPSVDYIHNWHIDCISEHLTAVWEKEVRRLIINIPPRFMKTLLCSVMFPAWGFAQNPSMKFMLTSFKAERAESMTRKTRIIMNSPWYQELAPHVRFAQDQNKKNFFSTDKQGQYYASAMESVTGEGSQIQICDDPLSPMDAKVSDTKRIRASETIRETLFSRFNDSRTGAFILVMQRLHEDDPTGNLLQDEGWTHLKLPAEVNKKTVVEFRGKRWEYDDSGLLFPEMFTQEVLDEKKESLGAYGFAGQYLQEPAPLGGGEFKKDYINYYRSADFDATRCNLYITVDPATSKKKTSDYTAMAVWALAPDQNYYLIDGVRERLNPTERINKLFDLHQKWNKRTKKPAKVGWEEYGMMSDNHYIQEKQRLENYRFPVTPVKSKLAKEERIRKLIPVMEQGRMWFPNDIMVKDYKGLPKNFISDIVETEMMLFPFAKHDDFMDAMSMIFDMDCIFPRVGTVETTSDYLPQSSEPSVFDL